MKTINIAKYTTTIIDVEYNGEEYVITHSEDYDDIFTSQWKITNIDNEEVEDTELFNELKEFAKKHI